MRKNAFIDLLLNWDTMSKHTKIQRLQSVENMMARYQGRKPRIISTDYNAFTIKNIGLIKVEGRDPSACYSRHEKDKIYILDLKQDVYEIIKDVIHEGFHAYVDDFIEGRVPSLRLYSKLDKERFLFEEENLPTIAEACLNADAMQLFDSYYAEERLNYQEGSLYMIKLILDSIDSVKDAIELQKAFTFCLTFYSDNERRGKNEERRLGIKYDDLVLQALQAAGENPEKCDVSKAGKIYDEIDPELLKFFNELSQAYQKLVSVRTNILMTPQAKEDETERLSQMFNEVYSSHIKSMLKAKKKN